MTVSVHSSQASAKQTASFFSSAVDSFRQVNTLYVGTVNIALSFNGQTVPTLQLIGASNYEGARFAPITPSNIKEYCCIDIAALIPIANFKGAQVPSNNFTNANIFLHFCKDSEIFCEGEWETSLICQPRQHCWHWPPQPHWTHWTQPQQPLLAALAKLAQSITMTSLSSTILLTSLATMASIALSATTSSLRSLNLLATIA
jgi:hypothetical protein